MVPTDSDDPSTSRTQRPGAADKEDAAASMFIPDNAQDNPNDTVRLIAERGHGPHGPHDPRGITGGNQEAISTTYTFPDTNPQSPKRRDFPFIGAEGKSGYMPANDDDREFPDHTKMQDEGEGMDQQQSLTIHDLGASASPPKLATCKIPSNAPKQFGCITSHYNDRKQTEESNLTNASHATRRNGSTSNGESKEYDDCGVTSAGEFHALKEAVSYQEDVQEMNMQELAERYDMRIRELEESHDARIRELEQKLSLLSPVIPGTAENDDIPTSFVDEDQRVFMSHRSASYYSLFRNYQTFIGGDQQGGESLENDTFALMMFSNICSRSWTLGFTAFVFQIVLGCMIAYDQYSESSNSSIFAIPFKVDLVVRVGQFFTIILCLATQSDILTAIHSIMLLGRGSNWDEVIGEYGNGTTRIWLIRILLPNLLKFLQGFLVMFVSFVIIVQSDDVIVLLKDFTALMVLSETDNILFHLAIYGYLGQALMEQAVKVSNATLPESPTTTIANSTISLRGTATTARTSLACRNQQRTFYFRSFVLFCLFAPMFGGWVAIVRNQENGKFFADRYPKCDFDGAFKLAREHFKDGTCYGGPLNNLGCEFEGGDCLEFNIAYPLCKGNDELTDVQQNVGNGKCQEKYMIPQCDYDGGDCCPYSIINSPLFGDGKCHGAFNVAGCGFDGGDCNVLNEAFPDCPLSELSSFDGADLVILGNGVCDGGIYSVDSCGWEYGDCERGHIGQDFKFIPFEPSLDFDGRTLAIASHPPPDSGADSNAVTVHRYDPSKTRWVALGLSLMGDEGSTKYFGMSVSMNQEGDRIAIGDHLHFFGSGQVQLFDFLPLNQTWVQVGQSILGQEHSKLGRKVDLSADGSRLAVSAPEMNGGAGQISVYEFDSAQHEWHILGQPMNGTFSSERIGNFFVHVSSHDGNTVMFSAGDERAQIINNRINRYDEISQDWIQLGQDLPSRFYASGSSLSSNGNRIAIPSNAAAVDAPGQVQVFDYDETNNLWVQVGETIFGTDTRNVDGFGYSMAMADDGNILSISSVDPNCDETCATGSVQIYHFSPIISSFIPAAATRLIENGNKIVERKRDRDSTVFGRSVSLSGDGSTLSIYSYDIDEKAGSVRVYDLNEVFYPRCVVTKPHLLGDGVCHDEYPYNSAECGFDYGDCPLPSAVEGFPGCYVTDPSKIGDGECQWENLPMYNTAECGYDGDDCENNEPVDKFHGRSATIDGFGDGIDGQDSFHFVYTEVMSTNFEIIVRMDGYINGYDYEEFAKYALIVRDGLNPGSKSFALALNHLHFLETVYRPNKNGNSVSINYQDLGYKDRGWLKIVRRGNYFSCQYKENGSDEFESVGYPTIIDMPSNVQIGVGMPDNGAREDEARVKFSDFHFNPYPFDTRAAPIENVALYNKRVSQSSSHATKYFPSRAVDGLKEPEDMTHTGLNDIDPWWQVILDQAYYISHITIYNRDLPNGCDSLNCSARLQGFRVEVIDSNKSDGPVWTYNDPTPSGGDPGTIITIVPPMDDLIGDTVKISIPGKKKWLHLREVEVYAAPILKNVALHNGSTSQSSTFHNSSIYFPHIAVDGLKEPEEDVNGQGMTHTEEDHNPWWQVILDQAYYISHITIYNRDLPKGCGLPNCSARLQGFRVEVIDGNKSNNTVWTYDDPTPSGGDPGTIIKIVPPMDELIGDTVRISIPEKRQFLHLREVEVYTAPAILDINTRIDANTYYQISDGAEVRTGGDLIRFSFGEHVVYRNINFGSTGGSVTGIRVRYARGNTGGSIEARLGRIDGELIGTIVTDNTGGWENFETHEYNFMKSVSGVHNLAFVGRGAYGLWNLRWFELIFD